MYQSSPSSSSSSSSSMESNNSSSSCSHWYHAPFYVIASLLLAFIAISSTKHSSNQSHILPTSHEGLAQNASHALRSFNNFHIFAMLLRFSPELFFHTGSQQATVFAIQDSAISNLSMPPFETRELLRFHTSPHALPSAQLFKKPKGFCFETLIDHKNLAITEKDPKNGSIEINEVLITHPDMFLDENFVVHGVMGPFDSITSTVCGSNDEEINVFNATEAILDWIVIVRALSSSGFVSFAIGLNSILDGIVGDYEGLGSVTIFAPFVSGFLAYPTPLLDRTVRVHIVPERFSYRDLFATEEASLRTLLRGYELKIDRFLGNIGLSGVEITAPDAYLSDKFVIHGIVRAFDVDELSSSYK